MTDLPSAHFDDPARRRDRLHGLVVVGVAFLVSLGISFWAKRVSEPEQGLPPAPPTKVGVIGWPNGVDPVKTLPAARQLTRRSHLRGFVADGVREDGTLDFGTATARVRYAFQSPSGQGPQPPRVPGLVPRRNLCGRQSVQIGAAGLVADADQPDLPCPPTLPDPLPEPRCTLAEIWAHARAKGALPGRVARIEYYRAAAGPAWRFEFPDGSLRFSIYGDCARELSRSEANGSVP